MRSSSVNTLILETLEHEGSHLDAHAVYERIRVNLPAVNPSTVYRALERLSRAGQVSVSDMGTGKAVYEAVGSAIHHHLVCQSCGKILTLDHQAAQEFLAQVERQSGFTIVTNHLVLFGVCPVCRALVEKDGEKN